MTQPREAAPHPSLRQDLLPAYFEALERVETMPILNRCPSTRKSRIPHSPGLRPVVRQLVVDHIRHNLQALRRHFSAQAALTTSNEEPLELTVLDRAQQALPASRGKYLLLAFAACAAAISAVCLAVLPQPVGAFVAGAWFDLVTLDFASIADAYPTLDGVPGHGPSDAVYLLMSILFMGTVILLPLVLVSGSYRVSRWILHGSGSGLAPNHPGASGATEETAEVQSADVIRLGRSYALDVGAPYIGPIPGELLPRLLTPTLLSGGALLFAITLAALPEARFDFAAGYRESAPAGTDLNWWVAGASMAVPLVLLVSVSIRRTRALVRQWHDMRQGKAEDESDPTPYRIDPLGMMWCVACLLSVVPFAAMFASVTTMVWSRSAAKRRTGVRLMRARRIMRWSAVLSSANVAVGLLLFLA